MSVFRGPVVIMFVLFWSATTPCGAEYIQAPAAIQIASIVSDGKLARPEIVSVAREKGIKVLVITDRDLMRWEYGIWPLRSVIKRKVEAGSISTYGIERYLQESAILQKNNPDMVLLNGVESAPFYYWKGSIAEDNLAIVDWHKHILSIGLDSYDDLRHLPVVGNRSGLAKPFSFSDVLHLWPVLLLLIGIGFFRKREYEYADNSGKKLGPYARAWQITGILLIIVSALFIWNGFPFRSYAFDQYHGEQGKKPYQYFIDYVRERGGLTFWAHPEAANTDKQGIVSIQTPEHSEYIFQTDGYTGFAIFHEGYETVGVPGGLWDAVLTQYCLGKRTAPVWAIGGLAFDSRGGLGNELDTLRTVLLVEKLDKQACLEALRKGRMYVVRGKDAAQFVLSSVIVRDSEGACAATMGETAATRGTPEIRLQGDYLPGRTKAFTVKLIRNNTLIKTFESTVPFDLAYRDDQAPAEGLMYYRIQIQGPDVTVITNPVFVHRTQRP